MPCFGTRKHGLQLPTTSCTTTSYDVPFGSADMWAVWTTLFCHWLVSAGPILGDPRINYEGKQNYICLYLNRYVNTCIYIYIFAHMCTIYLSDLCWMRLQWMNVNNNMYIIYVYHISLWMQATAWKLQNWLCNQQPCWYGYFEHVMAKCMFANYPRTDLCSCTLATSHTVYPKHSITAVGKLT